MFKLRNPIPAKKELSALFTFWRNLYSQGKQCALQFVLISDSNNHLTLGIANVSDRPVNFPMGEFHFGNVKKVNVHIPKNGVLKIEPQNYRELPVTGKPTRLESGGWIFHPINNWSNLPSISDSRCGELNLKILIKVNRKAYSVAVSVIILPPEYEFLN